MRYLIPSFMVAVLLMLPACSNGLHLPSDYVFDELYVVPSKPGAGQQVTIHAHVIDPFSYTDQTPDYRYHVNGGEMVADAGQPYEQHGADVRTYDHSVTWTTPATPGDVVITVDYASASRTITVHVY